MPQVAPKPGVECGALVRDGTARCEKQKRQAWVQRATYKRTIGRRLHPDGICVEMEKHLISVLEDAIEDNALFGFNYPGGAS